MTYYYTYLINNIQENKFYIGSRQCEIDPIKDLGIRYFSSSSDKDFIFDQKQNHNRYEYIVFELFFNREECLKAEIELHEAYNVSKNKSFYNRAKQTSTGFNVSGMVAVKDKVGNTMHVSVDDPRYLSGELVHANKETVSVKDKDGVTMRISVDDPRYLSGELIPMWKDWKHSDETKSKIGKANSIRQSGSGNSQYGTIWITNLIEKKNRKIKKTELIPNGWVAGRNMVF